MSSQVPHIPAGGQPQVPPDAQRAGGVWAKMREFAKKVWRLVPKRLSLPAAVALLTLLLLASVVVVVWGVYLNDLNHVPWRHWMTPLRIVVVVVLVLVIPLFVYRAVRLWLEGDKSLFSDIDFAWKAGLRALAEHGISVQSTPIFLILGSPDLSREKAIIDASGLNLRVRDVPQGPAPLHWYANPEGIYLFCSEASWLSAMTARVALERQRGEVSGLPGPAPRAPMPAVAPQPTPQSSPAVSNPAGSQGTMMLEAYRPGAELPASSPAASASNQGQSARSRGTLTLQAFDPGEARSAEARSTEARSTEARSTTTMNTDASERVATEAQPAILSARESSKQVLRLAYVCQLLRNLRQPVCPVNGVITLLPFAIVQSSSREVEHLENAVRADLETIRSELAIRCPVTALVTGLEQERGFRELIRRVGRERASTQRFGQRFALRGLASMEEMAAYCSHVCGVFEDWIYTLFRDEQTLTRPGNTHLYGLLCKIRFSLKERLSNILEEGFGFDPQRQPENAAVPFSGCYFAATGTTSDRQAFVKGVFDKLVEEQEQIEWTDVALKGERKLKTAATVGFVSAALLIASLAGMFWYSLQQ